MTRIFFHQLPGTQRAVAVLQEVLHLYNDQRKCLVWLADEGRRTAFDEYLWNYEKLAFIPHIVWQAGMEEVPDPIVLLGDTFNPNASEVLVVADDLPPADWIGGFSEIHEFLSPGEAGETRKAWWIEWQKEHREEK